jgi:TonB-dependent Receptor Plug Domain/CarboxypepD_reg-like domain/TonB dependent receptor
VIAAPVLARITVAPAVLVAMLLFGPSAGDAQGRPAATLAGRVTDRSAQLAVVGATVTVEGSALATRTDSVGRWRLAAVPAGPQVLLVRRVGFAPARLQVIVPAAGTLERDVALARTALELETVNVTADPAGRARGEATTASVIGREAIANQTAASLAGVLELVPGVPLAPPGLDGVQQVALRNGPTGAGPAGLTVGGASAADLAAFGTLIVIDGVPLSNNANLQSLGPRSEVSAGTSAQGGIDLRRIPAATLERVEVIRGLPSARWGDLTQGAIIVETRAAAVAPELGARWDARTLEASVVGGREFARGTHVVTTTADLASTRISPTTVNATSTRTAMQLAHRWRPGVATAGDTGRVTVDSRVDYFRVFADNPERPAIQPGRASRDESDGLRVSQRARWAMAPRRTLELTWAADVQRQRTYQQLLRTRPVLPFTDRTEPGRALGRYLIGEYLSHLTLEGDPRLLYGRLEGDMGGTALGADARLRVGTELRREWNAGAGYRFDIETPPQSSFDGINGFDRPERADRVAPLPTSAGYADLRLLRTLPYGMTLDLQPGLRLDVFHRGEWWLSKPRDQALQPRLAAQLAPVSWVRLRGSAGRTAKLPPASLLYPPPQWFDFVNVNRFTPNPAERLAVLTTFRIDPTNADLGLAVADKREWGVEVDLGRPGATLAVVRFDDRVSGAAGFVRDPIFLLRDIYALADTGIGSGQPGRIVEPPIGADTVPVFVSRPRNSAAFGTRGWEVTLALPEIPGLRTRLEVLGAFTESDWRTGERDLGNGQLLVQWQRDPADPRTAYWEGSRRTGERDILTWRLVHRQPDAGLVITAVVQQTIKERRADVGGRDTLAFAGYLTRTGEFVPVPPDERTGAEYADLRRGVRSLGGAADIGRDWIMGLQVAKSLPAAGRLAFYAFNVLDRPGEIERGRVYSPMRFGVELTMPLGGVVPW